MCVEFVMTHLRTIKTATVHLISSTDNAEDCRDDDTDEAGVWRQDAGKEREEWLASGMFDLAYR